MLRVEKDIPPVYLSASEEIQPKDNNALNLLFIHGMDSSKETWQSLRPLAKHYNIRAIDLRGHGESPTEGEVTLEKFVVDIDNYIKTKGLSQVILVAHSMGARIAVTYAAQYHQKVQALVLIDMDMLPREPREIILEEQTRLKSFQQEHKSLEDVYREMVKFGYPQEKIDSWVHLNRIKWDAKKECYHIGLHPYHAFCAHNSCQVSDKPMKAFQKLKQFEIPVLLLQASQDSSISPDGLQQMQAALPKMIVKKIPNSSHSIHKTATKECLKQITKFLNELPSC